MNFIHSLMYFLWRLVLGVCIGLLMLAPALVIHGCASDPEFSVLIKNKDRGSVNP